MNTLNNVLLELYDNHTGEVSLTVQRRLSPGEVRLEVRIGTLTINKTEAKALAEALYTFLGTDTSTLTTAQ